MKIEDFIKKAQDGGYELYPKIWGKFYKTRKRGNGITLFFPIASPRRNGYVLYYWDIFMNPEVWRAVGKELGWETEDEKYSNVYTVLNGNNGGIQPEWQNQMENMVESITLGKSLEEFIESL